jgi:DNA-binding NtrC family response regulator
MQRSDYSQDTMGDILIVDDEAGVRGMLEVVLRRDGHRVRSAGSGPEALALIAEHAPELVFSDLRMEPMDGLALLGELRKRGRQAPFTLIMTAYAEWDTAVRAMHHGAFDLLRKPFDNQVARTLANRALAARERFLSQDGEHPTPVHLVGSSPAIQQVQALVEQVSTTDSTVLVTGESGTGKELVARAVHYASLRADGPMVRINSGALAPSLLESELFGHIKGAFTGAIEDRPGLFALAHRGTLFLDEVGDLAPETQIKLLRVLENGEYLPVGSREVRTCNVRVVAATNRDLSQMVQSGAFREDLYYRLAVIPVHLPPLRQRREDIPLLAGHLLARHAVRMRRGITGFMPEALAAMQAHPWSGNIRELDNRIQRGVALTTAGAISRDALFADFGSGAHTPVRPVDGESGSELTERLKQGQVITMEDEVLKYERRLVEAALERTGDNLTEAAALLGISFRQIRYKVRTLGLR